MDEQYYFNSAVRPDAGAYLQRTATGEVDGEQRLRWLPVPR